MGTNATGRSRRLMLVIAALMPCALLMSTLSVQSSPIEWPVRNDFAHYYITSKLLGQGVDPYAGPITGRYAEHGLQNDFPTDWAGNPPALAVLFVPFSALPPALAFFAWQLLQLASLVSALFLLAVGAGSRDPWRLTVLILMAAGLSYPVVSHFEFSQTQCLILLLVVLGARGLSDSAESRHGPGLFLWGVAASLKLITFPLLGVAIGLRGLRGAAYFLAGCCFLSVLAWPLAGATVFQSFQAHAVPYVLSTLLMFSKVSFSIAGFCINNGLFSPSSALLSRISWAGIGATCLVGYLLARSRRLPLTAVVGSTLALCCISAPTGWAHYFVLTLFGVPMLVVDCERSRFNDLLIAALYGVALFLVNQNYFASGLVGSAWGFVYVGLYLLAMRRLGNPSIAIRRAPQLEQAAGERAA